MTLRIFDIRDQQGQTVGLLGVSQELYDIMILDGQGCPVKRNGRYLLKQQPACIVPDFEDYEVVDPATLEPVGA